MAEPKCECPVCEMEPKPMFETVTTTSGNIAPDRPLGLVDGRSGDRDLEEVVAAALVRCFRLWQQRQRKYGRGNISRHGALGCLIRDTDKTARLERYYLEGKKDEMVDETVVDTWMDKVNYALMGLVCFERNWPSSPEQEKK